MPNSADGEVSLRLVVDDSEMENGLNRARQSAEQSAERTAESVEDIEEEHNRNRRRMQEETTEHNREQNEEQEQDTEESYEKREGFAKKHADTLKGFASGTAKAIGASMLATGTAVAGIGVAAVNSANDMQKAMNQFAASTGIPIENTENYKKVMEEVYANNYGENFEDVATAMAEVKKQMTYLDDTELKNVTESAFTLRDTFGYEVAESVRVANSMVDSFGVSADEAFNLIAQGAQYGLDYSDELVDSINEYSPQFKKLGLDAEDMFQVFASGTNAGAFNLDKIGDAVKELSIRVIDGSETTADGFTKIGLNAEDMAAKFAAGGDSARQAFMDTIDGLAKIEDPIAKNTAGVDLFGSMWEDLGGDVITALTETNDGIDKTYDSMGKLKEVKYNDIGAVFEGLKRAVEVLIIPLGEQLIPLLSQLIQDVLPLIEENLPLIIDMIGGFTEQLIPIVQDILPVLMEALETLMPSFMQIVQEILPIILQLITDIAPLLADLISAVLPVIVELFEALLPPLMEIISKLLPPLIELVAALMPIFQTVIDLLMPIIDLFIGLLDPIISLINGALVPLANALSPIIKVISDLLIPILNVLMGVFDGVFTAIVNNISTRIQTLTNILNGIINFIKSVFTGDWKGAWEAVKDIFGAIAEGIGNMFKKPINFIIDTINGFIKGLNKIQIPDWVPSVGGKGLNIPKIPRLKVGMDYVPSDYFPAFLDYGERVLTQQENNRFNALGGIEGMEKVLSREYAMVNNFRDNNSLNVDISGDIYTTVELDRKAVGKSVTPIVGSELAYSGKGRR